MHYYNFKLYNAGMNLQRRQTSDEKQWSMLERALSMELGGLHINPSLAFLSLWDPG